jgi:hypothetical protein
MRATLDVLQAFNELLLDRRWTEAEIRQLVEPRFGVVSSFERLSQDLSEILKKDLGDIPPEVKAGKEGV